ncbi:recombinase family protein [Rouxiella badensis]|uniref:recombinase family protein n=1 Tax=Rouxiella badensis TaxID=1646377 RepID=UPI001D147B6A|nr:recombinase family protein [Rouxiella badensis]MCC3734705.1 recombinase family protein [Rouxiella badensis]MCC3760490.1 recombinase family protein [Rouxiella badensis]
MKYGYVRVSTKEQNTARQETALKPLCDELVIDKVSGKNADRPQLQALLQRVRSGDSVVVKSVDRLARNTKDLLTLLDALMDKGVAVQFIDNNLTFDAGDPTSRFMITMLGAVGELERSFIRQRQTEGIAIAKEEGKFKGRSKNKELRAEVRKQLERGLSNDEVAKLAGCGVATVYRIKRELNSEFSNT